MGLFRHRFHFRAAGDRWRAEVEIARDAKSFAYRLRRAGAPVDEVTIDVTPTTYFTVRTIEFDIPEGVLALDIGARGAWSFGVIAYLNGEEVYRSHKEPHRVPPKWQRVMEHVEQATDESGEGPEADARRAQQKELRDLQPSIFVDIGLGVIFFFVAREFGLVTAAVAGAVVTAVLFPIQRLVKMNLLGGFAVFGMVMALLSAGLALAFQDDTFVKLRGSVMGAITATLFLTDGLFGGRYLGKRMALYMSGVFRLSPRRAAIAMGSAGLVLILIDLPLVFLLTTEQWIFYNAFLDMFVAMPIVFIAMYYARERRSPLPPAANEA